jgi:hypothetical protein
MWEEGFSGACAHIYRLRNEGNGSARLDRKATAITSIEHSLDPRSPWLAPRTLVHSNKWLSPRAARTAFTLIKAKRFEPNARAAALSPGCCASLCLSYMHAYAHNWSDYMS